MKEDRMIEDGKRVRFNYTLKTEGRIVDSTKDGPFEYVHGKDDILPALKNQLEGMSAGEEKTVVLPPEEAYGERNPEAFQEVSRQRLPESIKPEIGMTLQLKTEEGENKLARISGIRDDSVVLDFNHPLAGKTLKFEVKIMDVIS